METVNLVQGQRLVEEGERPKNFYRVVSGRLRYGSVEFAGGDFVGVVEYFSERPFESSIEAVEDTTLERYDASDLDSEGLFDELVQYMLKELASVFGVVERDVVRDLEATAEVTKIAEVAKGGEIEEYALEAIQKVLQLEELPTLPRSEERAFELVSNLDPDEDPIKYVTHRIAFAKAFPDSLRTPDLLLEAAKVYLERLGDRYGAKYSLKLLFLFQPDSEDLKEALKLIVRVLRMDMDPEWFEYLERFLIHFPDEEVSMDEIS